MTIIDKIKDEKSKREAAARAKAEQLSNLEQKFIQFYDLCTDGDIDRALKFFENPFEDDNQMASKLGDAL